MGKEVLNFREKIGKVLMSLGIATIFSSLLVYLVWLGMPMGTVFPSKLLVVLAVASGVLIRLSLLTIKK